MKHESQINVHLYPSDFLHETRIEKIAITLRDFSFFQSIWLIGVAVSDLPEKEVLHPGVTLFRVGRPTMRRSLIRKLVAFVRYYFSAILLLRNAPVSCVNAHSLSVLPLAIFLKLFKRCIVIYDTHELETETYSLSGFRQKLAKVVERVFIRKVDLIFCVSKKISEWYASEYELPEPVTILNSTELIPPVASNVLREQFELSQDQIVLLYFGVIEPGRGIELLLETFDNAPGSKVVLVIVGYGSLVDTITSARAYGKSVFYKPAVPKQEIPSIAASADLGVCVVSPTCLSYDYCMPNKLFEYLTSGLPVLVSPCSTLQEFVNENEVGSVLYEMTPQGVLQAIESLMNSDLSAMKNKARAVALEHSWPAQQMKLKNAYDAVLNIS